MTIRSTVLPLPTGRFIVVLVGRDKTPIMLDGVPCAYTGPGLGESAKPGDTYAWRNRHYTATTFTTYRSAQAVVNAVFDGSLAFEDADGVWAVRGLAS